MIKKFSIIAVIIIILEIFVFNFQSLKSHILNYQESVGETVYEDTEKSTETKITIKNINTKVNNIYIDYENLEQKSYEENVTINYKDESFSDYNRHYGEYRELTHTMTVKNERSKYIKCNFIGNAKEICLTIQSPNLIKINNIQINKKIPFEFNIVRVAILIIIICGAYALLTTKFFRNKFDINNKKQKVILNGIVLIFILILILMLVATSYEGVWGIWINRTYGIDFVNSLKQGKVNIDIEQEVMEILNNANNPYDITEVEKQDLKNCFDIAYYNQKVYVYYGILPALILLLPFNLITGEYLPIHVGTFIFLAIGAIFTIKLLKEIIYRYYKKVPFALVVIFSLFILFNNKILGVMARPHVYEFVIAAGYCFVMAGLYMFFKYLRCNKKRQLFGSCLLMALAVACRPPTLFISIIIFIKLIYDIIQKIKDKKIKETIPVITIAIIPYAIIGILLMLYNYIRFENIFEFGANYQVSVTDFRRFGMDINRIFIGLTAYFISPVKVIPTFPFVTSENWLPEYNGYYFSIAVGGGYFATSLIGIVIVLLPWLRKKIKKYNKEMSIFIIITIILGLFIAIFESNKCGSLGRYMMDFIWLFNIVAILLVLFIYKQIKSNEYKKLFIKILMIIILISCIINTLMIYSYEAELLKLSGNIDMYYFIKYMFCFWL